MRYLTVYHSEAQIKQRCGCSQDATMKGLEIKMRVGNVGKGQVMALWLAGAIVVALAVGIWLYVTYPH